MAHNPLYSKNDQPLYPSQYTTNQSYNPYPPNVDYRNPAPPIYEPTSPLLDGNLTEEEAQAMEYGYTITSELEPSVLGTFIVGILLLATQTATVYYLIYAADIVVAPLIANWQLTYVASAYLLVLFFAIFPLSLSCFPGCRQNKTPIKDFGFAVLTQLFIVGYIVIAWELSATGCQKQMENYCTVFRSIKLLLLLFCSLPWKRERSDVGTAFAICFIVAAINLAFWNTQFSWNWSDWAPKNWYYFFGYVGSELLFVFAAICGRLSVRTPRTNFGQIFFTHIFCGTLFSWGCAIGFEISRNWNEFKQAFKVVSGPEAGELIGAVGILGILFGSVVLLLRYSDMLTTAMTVELAMLLPIIALFIQTVVTATKPVDVLSKYPLQTAASALTFVALIYWIIRVSLLGFCFNRANRHVEQSSLLESEHLVDTSGKFFRN